MVYYDEATILKLPTPFKRICATRVCLHMCHTCMFAYVPHVYVCICATRVCLHMCVSSQNNLFRIFRLCKTSAYSRCWLHVYVCIFAYHPRLLSFTFSDSAIPRHTRSVDFTCRFAHVRISYMRVMCFISFECAMTWPTRSLVHTCIFAYVRVLYVRAVYSTSPSIPHLSTLQYGVLLALLFTCASLHVCVSSARATCMFVDVHVCKCACL